MLLAGLDMDPWEILKHKKAAFLVALFGLIIPFTLGFLAVYFFGHIVGLIGVTKIYAAMIFGVCLSITAVAMKTRVLMEEKFLNHRLAKIMLGASVFDDIMSLLMFTIIFDLIKLKWLQGSSVLPQLTIDVLFIFSKVIIFFIAVFVFAYYAYPFIYRKLKTFKGSGFTFTIVTALLFSLLAELAGLHFIVGAYIAGLFISKEKIGDESFDKTKLIISSIALGFLAPFFFVGIGVHLDLTVFSLLILPFLVLAILIAIIGKTFGAAIGAKLAGLKTNESLFIGLSMNGKAALELIIAELGRQAGILPLPLFSVIVIMAIFSTFLSPLMIKLAGFRLLGKKH